jgi:hypothetical protein
LVYAARPKGGEQGTKEYEAQKAYDREHPEAFIIDAWVDGRPYIVPYKKGEKREQDWGDDYEQAQELFGEDIWEVVAAYKQLRPYVEGGDNSHFYDFKQAHPQYEKWSEWWYEGPDGESGTASNKSTYQGYVKGKYNSYDKDGNYTRRSSYRKSSYRPSYSRRGSGRSYSKYGSSRRSSSSGGRRYSSSSGRRYSSGGGGRYTSSGGGGYRSYGSGGRSGGGGGNHTGGIRPVNYQPIYIPHVDARRIEPARARDNTKDTLGSWRRWIDLD